MNPRIFKEYSCPELYKHRRRIIANAAVGKNRNYPTSNNDQLSMVKFWMETANMGIFDLTQIRTFESGLGGFDERIPFIDANHSDTDEILEDFF